MKFKKSFFEDQVREGFLVTEMMKRAWAAEMEVLQVVSEVCERNDIMWFVDAGTLLGAVRHQGFIPWDDDIDICLLRPEYNRLIGLLQTELPDGFVLTGMYADSERLQRAAYVPNVRVMADEEYWEFSDYLKRFHGFPFFRIGIDIFPLDFVPRDSGLSDWQREMMGKIWLLLVKWDEEKDYPLSMCEKELQEVERMSGVSLPRDETVANHLWKLYDSVTSRYSWADADYVAVYHFWYNCPRKKFRKECYETANFLPFENISVPVPADTHEVLTAYYGDYRTPVKGAAVHDYPFYASQQEALQEIFDQKGIKHSITEFCRGFMEQVYAEEIVKQRETLHKEKLDIPEIRERLMEIADLFYQNRIADAMSLFPDVVEMLLQIPGGGIEAANALLDAVEHNEYDLAANILYNDIAEQLDISSSLDGEDR